MNIEEWNVLVSVVTKWMETKHDLDGGSRQTINFWMGLGFKDTATNRKRSRYSAVIISEGTDYPDFPLSRIPTSKYRRSELRQELKYELSMIMPGIKDRGRVIMKNGIPSLENLVITANVWKNEIGLSKKKEIYSVCEKYSIKPSHILITEVTPTHPQEDIQDTPLL